MIIGFLEDFITVKNAKPSRRYQRVTQSIFIIKQYSLDVHKAKNFLFIMMGGR